MRRYYKIGLSVAASLLAIVMAFYMYLFYPRQIMPVGEPIAVLTPDTAKYHNDCLHPCVRYCEVTDTYYMAQSPYYAWNNKVENPMFYVNDNYTTWNTGTLIASTPKTGFNSDPCICIDSIGQITYIWRECYTPLCDSLGCTFATVGGKIVDGHLEYKQIFCVNIRPDQDAEQAPVIVNHNGINYIYATWYQYEPERKNRGIAIWKEGLQDANEGGRMCKYQFVDTIPFKSCYTVDKCAQVRLFNHFFYCPKPLDHDLWHFDLFEYGEKLYMVSVAEKGDNIMLSVSEDWLHFQTFRKPLVNNHFTENYCGYRQYYYKPTAFVQNDTLHLFYTANAKDDPKRNKLFHSSMPIKQILQ